MGLFDIAHLISTYGYVGIFVIVLIESGIFFFLPGDSLLFTAGLLAMVDKLNIFSLIVIAASAAALGNLFGYWIGVHIEELRQKKYLGKLLKDEYVERARIFFEKRGRSAILLSRFVPGLRTYTPWVAGVARMNKTVFVRWSIGSAIVWSTLLTLFGFFLGKTIPQAGKYLTLIILVIVTLSVIPAGVEWYRHRKTKAGE